MSEISVAIIFGILIVLFYIVSAWYKSRNLSILTQIIIDILIAIAMLLISIFFSFNKILLQITLGFFIYTVIGNGLLKFLSPLFWNKIENKFYHRTKKTGLKNEKESEAWYEYFLMIHYYFLELLIIAFFLYIVIFKGIIKI